MGDHDRADFDVAGDRDIARPLVDHHDRLLAGQQHRQRTNLADEAHDRGRLGSWNANANVLGVQRFSDWLTARRQVFVDHLGHGRRHRETGLGVAEHERERAVLEIRRRHVDEHLRAAADNAAGLRRVAFDNNRSARLGQDAGDHRLAGKFRHKVRSHEPPALETAGRVAGGNIHVELVALAGAVGTDHRFEVHQRDVLELLHVGGALQFVAKAFEPHGVRANRGHRLAVAGARQTRDQPPAEDPVLFLTLPPRDVGDFHAVGGRCGHRQQDHDDKGRQQKPQPVPIARLVPRLRLGFGSVFDCLHPSWIHFRSLPVLR